MSKGGKISGLPKLALLMLQEQSITVSLTWKLEWWFWELRCLWMCFEILGRIVCKDTYIKDLKKKPQTQNKHLHVNKCIWTQGWPLAHQVSDSQAAGRWEGNWEHCSSVLACLLMHLLLSIVGDRQLRPLISASTNIFTYWNWCAAKSGP